MKDILSNVWVKRAVSVFNLAYFAVIVLLTCATFMYNLEFASGKEFPFFTVYLISGAFFLGLMLYSRNEIITKIISILMLPLVFCLIIFNMANWILIIPPFVVAVVMFFAGGTSENVKVIFGTIYLLMYVLGLVAYFVLNLLFATDVETRLGANIADDNPEVYERYKDDYQKLCQVTSDGHSISPDGNFQFVIYDVENSDKGGLKICIEPYGEDIELKFFTLKQKGISKTVTVKGTRGVVPDVDWTYDDKGEMVIQYRLVPGDEPKKANTKSMPDKNYLEFLGIR